MNESRKHAPDRDDEPADGPQEWERAARPENPDAQPQSPAGEPSDEGSGGRRSDDPSDSG